ncbi:carotenoid biosynthesis protein [Bacillus sp. FSL W8-0645]|uniref:carotenoid biosynthesis protein n=1 Tax=Bacillus TaxID=1386 RepID=UPI0030FBEE00
MYRLSWVFIGWYLVGLILMVFFEVPAWLQFANGIFLVLYACCVIEIGRQIYGSWGFVIKRAAIVGVLTFTVEWVGITTGFPFGAYDYYPTLGFLVAGVPLTIAFAWVGVFLNSLFLSSQQSKWRRAVETGIWIVLLDLILDPVAAERKFWVWYDGGGFYGIPFENFVSWGMIGAGLSFLFPLVSIDQKALSWTSRIYQAMVFFFGLLALKGGLDVIFYLALIIVILCEGRVRFERKRQKPIV